MKPMELPYEGSGETLLMLYAPLMSIAYLKLHLRLTDTCMCVSARAMRVRPHVCV